MKYKLPTKPDGKMCDLPNGVSTMHNLDALCPTCKQFVISSSYKVFCSNCGVWWDTAKIMNNDTG